MNSNIKFGLIALLVLVIPVTIILYLNSKKSHQEVPNEEEIVESSREPEKEEIVEDNQETVEEETSNKICEWVDNSDIIIKVNIPEGIEKESSYEAGFYFNPIVSTMRLARQECEYRTGFSFTEFIGKTAADVGVRNYSDSERRVLVGEPIDVTFDSNGMPSIGANIEVTILR